MDNRVLKSPTPSQPFLTSLPPHKMSLLVSGMPRQECLIRFGGKPPPKRLINSRNGLVSGILPSVSVPPWLPSFFWKEPPRIPDLSSSIPPRGGVLPSCEGLLGGVPPYESLRQWVTQTVPRDKTPVPPDNQAAPRDKTPDNQAAPRDKTPVPPDNQATPREKTPDNQAIPRRSLRHKQAPRGKTPGKQAAPRRSLRPKQARREKKPDNQAPPRRSLRPKQAILKRKRRHGISLESLLEHIETGEGPTTRSSWSPEDRKLLVRLAENFTWKTCSSRIKGYSESACRTEYER